MNPNRDCPVCNTKPNKNDIIYHIPFSDGTLQEISCCPECGMVFASMTPSIEYSKESIYAASGATGSGDSLLDKEKFCGTVEILESEFPNKEISILDVGCAQGGLLSELERHSYENAMGMDLSQSCVDACRAKNLMAFNGSLDNPPTGKYDLIILSHVLEHVWNVPATLKWIQSSLKPIGKVYIEVPNAMEYENYLVCPFQDFNREHINHFSATHFIMVLNYNGFQKEASGLRELSIPGGKYPAMWSIFSLGDNPWTTKISNNLLKDSIQRYIEKSKELMHIIDLKLRPKLEGRNIAIWGYGEFSQQLFLTDAVQSAKIIQVIDKDPSKQGKLFHGISVESPDKLQQDIPVLVTSMLNSSAICRDIQKLNRDNPIILVEK